MSRYKDVMPHGELKQVFSGIHFVTGTTRPDYQGMTWQFSRNMTIVEHDGAVTLINTVRLGDEELARLDRIGKVQNVVKLGAFHGFDDEFYVDRYGAKLWALEGAEHESGLPNENVMRPGGPLPFPGCSLFVYETAKQPEGMLLIDRAGGVLVACDSLQNWTDADEYFDEGSAERMRQFGFFAPANVGPGWLRSSEPAPSDFERVKQLPFKHLLSAHGTPIRDTAHSQVCETFERLFGI